MIKLIGILSVFMMFVLIGNYFSGILKRRTEIFRQTRVMLDKMTTLIKYRSYSVFELCDEIKNDDTLSELSFVSIEKEDGIPFSQLWRKSIEKWNVPIKNNERDVYLNLGKSLGTTDKEGQISSLLLFDIEFEKLLSCAEKEYSEKSRLFRTLGILSGAFVSIILI